MSANGVVAKDTKGITSVHDPDVEATMANME